MQQYLCACACDPLLTPEQCKFDKALQASNASKLAEFGPPCVLPPPNPHLHKFFPLPFILPGRCGCWLKSWQRAQFAQTHFEQIFMLQKSTKSIACKLLFAVKAASLQAASYPVWQQRLNIQFAVCVVDATQTIMMCWARSCSCLTLRTYLTSIVALHAEHAKHALSVCAEVP